LQSISEQRWLPSKQSAHTTCVGHGGGSSVAGGSIGGSSGCAGALTVPPLLGAACGATDGAGALGKVGNDAPPHAPNHTTRTTLARMLATNSKTCAEEKNSLSRACSPWLRTEWRQVSDNRTRPKSRRALVEQFPRRCGLC
jgi:hypothetical protein